MHFLRTEKKEELIDLAPGYTPFKMKVKRSVYRNLDGKEEWVYSSEEMRRIEAEIVKRYPDYYKRPSYLKHAD